MSADAALWIYFQSRRLGQSRCSTVSRMLQESMLGHIFWGGRCKHLQLFSSSAFPILHIVNASVPVIMMAGWDTWLSPIHPSHTILSQNGNQRLQRNWNFYFRTYQIFPFTQTNVLIIIIKTSSLKEMSECYPCYLSLIVSVSFLAFSGVNIHTFLEITI